MKSNIVFLDFDGVIVVASTRFIEADPLCVARLNEITDKTDAAIVVSSSWRKGRTEKQLEDLLKDWGVKASMVGVTPILQKEMGGIVYSDTRGHEINAWVESNKDTWKEFVILDDDGDMQPLLHKLVRTSFDLGLQPEHVGKALALLSP